MQHPISSERVDYLKARIAVLHDMNLELSKSHYKWPQSSNQIKQQALESIQREKLQLSVELEVLEKYLLASGVSLSPNVYHLPGATPHAEPPEVQKILDTPSPHGAQAVGTIWDGPDAPVMHKSTL